MKIKYSMQALTIIKSLKHFDKEDFEKWLADNIEVGNSTIMSYILSKEKKNGNSK